MRCDEEDYGTGYRGESLGRIWRVCWGGKEDECWEEEGARCFAAQRVGWLGQQAVPPPLLLSLLLFEDF